MSNQTTFSRFSCLAVVVVVIAISHGADAGIRSSSKTTSQYKTGDYGTPDSSSTQFNIVWSPVLATLVAGLICVVGSIIECNVRMSGAKPPQRSTCVNTCSVILACGCIMGVCASITFIGFVFGEYNGSLSDMEEAGNEIGDWGKSTANAVTTANASISTAVATAMQFAALLDLSNPVVAADLALNGPNNVTRCSNVSAVSALQGPTDLNTILVSASTVTTGRLVSDAEKIDKETDDVYDAMTIRQAFALIFAVPLATLISIGSGTFLLRKLRCYPRADLARRPEAHFSALRFWSASSVLAIIAIWAVSVDFHLCTIYNANACQDFPATLRKITGGDSAGLDYFAICHDSAAYFNSTDRRRSWNRRQISTVEVTTASEKLCTDIPDWGDRDGTGCSRYVNSLWCSSNGTEGSAWNRTLWGNLSEWTDPTTGLTSSAACCGCGGGLSTTVQVLTAPGIPSSAIPVEVSEVNAITYKLGYLKLNLTARTYGCIYSARYQQAINGYVSTLTAIETAAAPLVAVSECSTVNASITKLEKAVCGPDGGLIVAIATYFELFASLAVAVTICHYLWSSTALGSNHDHKLGNHFKSFASGNPVFGLPAPTMTAGHTYLDPVPIFPGGFEFKRT